MPLPAADLPFAITRFTCLGSRDSPKTRQRSSAPWGRRGSSREAGTGVPPLAGTHRLRPLPGCWRGSAESPHPQVSLVPSAVWGWDPHPSSGCFGNLHRDALRLLPLNNFFRSRALKTTAGDFGRRLDMGQTNPRGGLFLLSLKVCFCSQGMSVATFRCCLHGQWH